MTKEQPISGPGPDRAEPRPRDFHDRVTRAGRSRPVLAMRRRQLRKRYAALAAVIAVPAMANAPEWQPGIGAGDAAAPLAYDRLGSLRQASAEAPFVLSGDALPLGGEIHSDAEDGLPPGARPLLAAGTATDRARAERCLTMAVYYEAAREPDPGQRAVAQVVLNRVAHPSYPDTVCGVVFQGSERSTGCQFTFTCDGSLARPPAALWWDRASRVAHAALTGAVFAPVGQATHYHTTQIHPYWADSLAAVTTIGAHRFYRWRGAAGQKAAFQVAYRGGEPVAAPHPRTFAPASPGAADPLVLARAFEAAQGASTGAGQVRTGAPAAATGRAAPPDYADAVEARGGDALFRADRLPGGGTVNPAFERSGQWLDRR
jgi:hypothetical protein